MYCSSCGSAVKEGLGYCNHCGARLSGAKDRGRTEPAGASPDGLVWAIVAVAIAGLGLLIGLMTVMKKELDFSNEVVIAFASLGFLIVLGAEAVFIWMLLSRLKGRAQEASDTAQLKELTTKDLGARQAGALPEPVPSVTEQTTRTFEPVYNERKAE